MHEDNNNVGWNTLYGLGIYTGGGLGKKLLMKEHAEAMKHIGVMILKVGGRDPSLLGG